MRDVLMGRLLDLSSVVDVTDVAILRKLVDDLCINFAQLMSIGCLASKDNLLMKNVVYKKFSRQCLLEWERNAVCNDDFSEMLNFMKKEVAVRERASTAAALSALVAQSTQQQKSLQPMKGTFCDGSHRPWQCQGAMPPTKRIKKVLKVSACLKCGMKGHMESDLY